MENLAQRWDGELGETHKGQAWCQALEPRARASCSAPQRAAAQKAESAWSRGRESTAGLHRAASLLWAPPARRGPRLSDALRHCRWRASLSRGRVRGASEGAHTAQHLPVGGAPGCALCVPGRTSCGAAGKSPSSAPNTQHPATRWRSQRGVGSTAPHTNPDQLAGKCSLEFFPWGAV